MTWLIIFLIFAFIAWRMMPPKGVRSVSTETLKTMLKDQDKQLLDVRTEAEYKARHIPEFHNYPLDTLPTVLNQLDEDKETIVICQSGMRSMQAARVLKRAGFTNIVNVSGGMNAWKS